MELCRHLRRQNRHLLNEKVAKKNQTQLVPLIRSLYSPTGDSGKDVSLTTDDLR